MDGVRCYNSKAASSNAMRSICAAACEMIKRVCAGHVIPPPVLPMPLLLMVLLVPAVVDGIAHEIPVSVHDRPNEKHLDVVFHGDEL